MLSRVIHTHSADETYQIGMELGKHLKASSVIALSGDLGAGKTTFTQGVAAGLGIDDRVTSPTFTLVNEYAIDAPCDIALARLIHIDSYRLGDHHEAAISEAETFGMEELLDDPNAVVVIEWAERLKPVLPDDHLWISLAESGSDASSRKLVFVANGPRSSAILQQL
jgi:tRNA threonylcarbamoyladenosine biosynthesis protein TsaE